VEPDPHNGETGDQSFDQREECAIWSDDPNLIAKSKVYFEEIFMKGKKLS